jgi:hypothetical protein
VRAPVSKPAVSSSTKPAAAPASRPAPVRPQSASRPAAAVSSNGKPTTNLTQNKNVPAKQQPVEEVEPQAEDEAETQEDMEADTADLEPELEPEPEPEPEPEMEPVPETETEAAIFKSSSPASPAVKPVAAAPASPVVKAASIAPTSPQVKATPAPAPAPAPAAKATTPVVPKTSTNAKSATETAATESQNKPSAPAPKLALYKLDSEPTPNEYRPLRADLPTPKQSQPRSYDSDYESRKNMGSQSFRGDQFAGELTEFYLIWKHVPELFQDTFFEKKKTGGRDFCFPCARF